MGRMTEAEFARKLQELELRLMRPAAAASAAELEALLDEEFVEFGSSGIAYDRATVIAALLREQPRAWGVSAFKVRQLSEDVVLVTYVARMGGGPSSLRCSVWKQSRGQWKMAFHQGTRIDE